jgi:hypothetical protein
MARSMAAVACDNETPSARLKDSVDATNCPSWLTDKEVVVGSKREKAASGICRDGAVEMVCGRAVLAFYLPEGERAVGVDRLDVVVEWLE